MARHKNIAVTRWLAFGLLASAAMVGLQPKALGDFDNSSDRANGLDLSLQRETIVGSDSTNLSNGMGPFSPTLQYYYPAGGNYDTTPQVGSLISEVGAIRRCAEASMCAIWFIAGALCFFGVTNKINV